MYRSLRVQLVAIVVGTVGTVLAISQWVDTRLSERALEQNLTERALMSLEPIDRLWDRVPPEGLRQGLVGIVQGNHEILAIDVFRRAGDTLQVAASTRPATDEHLHFDGSDAERVATGKPSARRVQLGDGMPLLQVSVPIIREGSAVGVSRADVTLAAATNLQHWLRRIDGAFLVISISLISLPLAIFLERRVTRPVAALVDGMRAAESGALGSRVRLGGGGEFAFLAHSFNRMVSRLEELTAGLESRVRQATQDLAEKNRELQTANQQLWEAQLEIGRSERMAALGHMAGTIAHELGTPLNSVLGYTQLLMREDLSPEQAGKLGIVESQVRRMIETIRSVLDRTRDRVPRRAPVALEPLVTEAIALVSTRLAGRDLDLRNEVPRDLPPIPGDTVALRQALLNLLTNAIDATDPPGVITVGASLVAANGAGPHMELRVSDTGHGMSAEALTRVFEPFYTTKEPGRGTGLGLAIVDHIVRAHGGQVLVESVPERGTTMRIRLPLET